MAWTEQFSELAGTSTTVAPLQSTVHLLVPLQSDTAFSISLARVDIGKDG